MLLEAKSCKWLRTVDPAPRSKSSTCAVVVLTTLVITERNSGVRLEARFALPAEHPDHYAYREA
jgi:hypothetical protein